MSKKIQVSTIKQTADVEVIALNSYFIAKCVRVQEQLRRVCLDRFSKHTIRTCDVEDPEKYTIDPDGNLCDKLTGEPILKHNDAHLYSEDVNVIEDVVLRFFDELTKAFEGE